MYNKNLARSVTVSCFLILGNTFHFKFKTSARHRNTKRVVLPSYNEKICPPNTRHCGNKNNLFCWTTDICLYCGRARIGCGLYALGAVALCGSGCMLPLYRCSAWIDPDFDPRCAYNSLQFISSSATPSTPFSSCK